MSHRRVDTPHRFLTLGRAYGYPALPPGDDRCVRHALERFELRFLPVEQPVGIVGEQFAVHALDVGGRFFEMGANHAVPVATVHQLNPCHIDLYESGTSPLPGFEQDEANGFSRRAHIFEHSQYTPLRSVQTEWNVFGSQFIFDTDKAECPKFEIVPNAHPYPLPP